MMRRRTGIFSVVVLMTLLVMVGYGLAGPVPDTGQTKCYDDEGNEITCPQPGEPFYGQDANYTVNPSAFTKLDAQGNGLPSSAASWVMVRDNVTGLIWEVKQNNDSGINYNNPNNADNTYTWYDSNPATNGGDAGSGTPGDKRNTEDFIAALNAANFGGYSDWRLPTISELESIVDLGRAKPSIDKTYFPNTKSYYFGGLTYWSATTHADDNTSARFMEFHDGYDTYGTKSEQRYARAVRGGQAQHAFRDNSDGTVTDTSTGLVWQKATAPGKYTWMQALSYCEDLSLAGHTDWRLPTRKELRSIVDYGRYNPSIDISVFPDTQASIYWSSTTRAIAPVSAWRIEFEDGFAYNYIKSYDHYVRAVRGGQSILSQTIYRFEEGDTPTGSVDLGDGVTATFEGKVEVGIVDNRLGFYMGQKPVQSSAIRTQTTAAGNLSFTFEDPIYGFTMNAADYDGNTTISAYNASGQVIDTTAVSGSDATTYALAWEQPVAKVVISGTSGWVGTVEELAVILGQVLSILDSTALQGVTVSISPSNRQGVSDASGNYTITGVKPGTYTLTGTGNKIAATSLTGLNIVAGSTLSQNLLVMNPVDGGYIVTDTLWAKAVLEVSGSPVALVWHEVGADLTPSGDQVISGYFYADPADFAYGSQYNPELFVKIYISATNGWCNIAFNHVTVDPVSVYSAHQYNGTADKTGSTTLQGRLVQHEYTGVAIDTSKQTTGEAAATASGSGYSLGSNLWSRAVLQVTNNPVTLIWKEVGTDTTPSGAKVISGYFYADPADFVYGSPFNPEVFVKVYIDPTGWANMAFNHVTVDPVSIESAHQYGGASQQSGGVTLNGRLMEHSYTGVPVL